MALGNAGVDSYSKRSKGSADAEDPRSDLPNTFRTGWLDYLNPGSEVIVRYMTGVESGPKPTALCRV